MQQWCFRAHLDEDGLCPDRPDSDDEDIHQHELQQKRIALWIARLLASLAATLVESTTGRHHLGPAVWDMSASAGALFTSLGLAAPEGHE